MADSAPALVKISTGNRLELAGIVTIGRQMDCTLVLSEGRPSRRHALITVSGDAVWLEDLQSTNGTFVNGKRIESKVRLSAGDRVRFDTEEFEFRASDQNAQDTVHRKWETSAPRTLVRALAPKATIAESTGKHRRPGAWVDPDTRGDSGSETKWIDPAVLRKMFESTAQINPGVANVPADVPCLIIASGPGKGRQILLQTDGTGKQEWTVGSDTGREIVLADGRVSGLHAKIVNEGQRWKIVDQMSANGTFVNSKRSSVSYLGPGDRVGFGPVECIVYVPVVEPPASAPVDTRSKRTRIMSQVVSFAASALRRTINELPVLIRTVLRKAERTTASQRKPD